MNISIVRADDNPDRAHVLVDGEPAATIRRVSPGCRWKDITGQTRIGRRWLPETWVATAPGPATKDEAAVAALIDAGYDGGQAMVALHLTRYRVVVPL